MRRKTIEEKAIEVTKAVRINEDIELEPGDRVKVLRERGGEARRLNRMIPEWNIWRDAYSVTDELFFGWSGDQIYRLEFDQDTYDSELIKDNVTSDEWTTAVKMLDIAAKYRR